MTKARVSFLLDTDMLSIAPNTDLRDYVLRNVIQSARANLKGQLRAAREADDVADETKAAGIADRMRASMALLMVEANLVVEEVDSSTAVETMLPHETAR